MSTDTLTTAGILLITNPVRRGLWTAGHAHAGVLVLLVLVALPYLDRADTSDGVRTLLVAAPILMPLGFFLSVPRPTDTRPTG